MFKIVEEKKGKTDVVKMVNLESGEYAEILVGFGAGLNDLVLLNSSSEMVSVIDGYRTEKEIAEESKFFKGSKLSPFPNRTKNGEFIFQDKKYSLPVNEIEGNNNLHGILYNCPFVIIEKSGDDKKAMMKIAHRYETLDGGFPFSYQIEIEYIFSSTGLTITTEVKNISDNTMPIGDGWHPYFKIGSKIDDVNFKIESGKRIASNIGNTIVGSHGFEQLQQIGNTVFDDCFEIEAGKNFNLVLIDKKRSLKLEISQHNEFDKYPYFQLYTLPSRTSIAIEPISCPPDALNSGIGLVFLDPAEKISWSFCIKYFLFN